MKALTGLRRTENQTPEECCAGIAERFKEND